MKSRADRFRQRVQKEREVIAILENFAGIPRLHGLSNQTIKTWQSKAISIGLRNLTEIVDLLLDISYRLQLSADLSKSSFDDENEIANVDASLSKLKDILKYENDRFSRFG